MATKLLSFARDIQGYCAYAPTIPTDMYSATLTVGGGASTVTIPGNFANWVARISCQQATNVWMSTAGTAAVPVGATFAATASVRVSDTNATWWRFTKDEVLSLITDSASSEVSIALWADPAPH